MEQDLDKIENMAELEKFLSVRKTLIYIFSSLIILSGTALIVLNYLFPNNSNLLKFFTALLIVAVFLLFITFFLRLKVPTIEFELDEIKEERKVIQKRISHAPQIFDTILLNLNHLTEYYVINKSQARNSFNFSIFAIILGLITIIGGIWIFYFRDTQNLQLATISSISGILTEFIGASYLFLYKKTLDQLNYFYDKLTETQNIMLAVKLADSIKIEEKKAEIWVKIITSLIPETKK